MIRAEIDESYATVGAREDIDGAVPTIVLRPNRNKSAEYDIELSMSPRAARMLARRLNRWAKLVSSR